MADDKPISLSLSSASSGTPFLHDGQTRVVKVKVEEGLEPRPWRFPANVAATSGREALVDSKDDVSSSQGQSREDSAAASAVAGETGHSPPRRTTSYHAPSASSRERTLSRTDFHVQDDYDRRATHSRAEDVVGISPGRSAPAGENIPASNGRAGEALVVDTSAPTAPNSTTDQPTAHSRGPVPVASSAETGCKRTPDDLGVEVDGQGWKRRKTSDAAGDLVERETGASASLPVPEGNTGPSPVPHPAKAVVDGPSRPGGEPEALPPTTKPTQPPAVAHLEMANARRRYDHYEYSDGTMVFASGALIPENYRTLSKPQMWKDKSPRFPWKCPVRSCQLVYPGLAEMGEHFIVHRHTLLRDECNGTFSVAGHHPRLSHDNVAVVVSTARSAAGSPSAGDARERNSDVDALPPPPPSPGPPNATTTSSREPHGAQGTKAAEPAAAVGPGPENHKAIWRYLFPIICHYSFKSGPELDKQGRDIIAAVLSCEETLVLLDVPRRRDIHWLKGSTFGIRTPRDAIALLIQITGREPPNPCAACSNGNGPLVGCIVLPSSNNATPHASTAPAFSEQRDACANCRYRGVWCSKPSRAAFSFATSSAAPPPRRGPGRPKKHTPDLLPWTAWPSAPPPQRDEPVSQKRVSQYLDSIGSPQHSVAPSNGPPAHLSPTTPIHGGAWQLAPSPPAAFQQPRPPPAGNYPPNNFVHGLPSPQTPWPQSPWPQTPSPQVPASHARHLAPAPARPGQQPYAHPQPWSHPPPAPVLSSRPSGAPVTGPPPAAAPMPTRGVSATGAAAPALHVGTPKQGGLDRPLPNDAEDRQPRRPSAHRPPPVEHRLHENHARGNSSTGTTLQGDKAPGRIVQLEAAQDNTLRLEDAQDGATVVEPWEKAPGRIRSTASESIDNIAFSKTYLGGGGDDGVRVSEKASFSVQSVAAGRTLELRASGAGTRLCSVARGRLHVQLAGEPIFVLGAHGLFKVNPGVACTVANETGLEAVLHVTTVLLLDV